MPTRRYFSNFAPRLTLATSIGSTDTSLQVQTTFASWPTQFPYFATLDYGTASAEIISVTGVIGATATIVRGQDGSIAIAHAAGATMDQTAIRQDYDEANAHTTATGTGIHGVTGHLVGDDDVQTLTNKTLTSPVINTPNVTGATSSNAVNTGDATHPALVGKATTAGGTTLSLKNSSGTQETSVDDAGNVTTSGGVTATGTVTAGNLTTAGAVNAASVTATGAVDGATASISGAASVGSLTIGGVAQKNVSVKQYSGTTDSNGYLIVTHGLGFTPAAVVCTPNSPITAGANASILMAVLADTFTSTTFRVRALDATPTLMTSTAITFSAAASD